MDLEQFSRSERLKSDQARHTELRSADQSIDDNLRLIQLNDAIVKLSRNFDLNEQTIRSATALIDLAIDQAKGNPRQVGSELGRLAGALFDQLDHASPDENDFLKKSVQEFHKKWLKWSLRHYQDSIPQILSSLQGRQFNSAEIALNDAAAQSDDRTSVWQKLQIYRQNLRQLTLAVQGDPNDSSIAALRSLAQSSHAEFKTAKATFAEANPDRVFSARELETQPKALATDLAVHEAIVLLFQAPSESPKHLSSGELELVSFAQLITLNAISKPFEVPELDACLVNCSQYEVCFGIEPQVRGGLRGVAAQLGHLASSSASNVDTQNELQLIRDGLSVFWRRLRSLSPGTRCWHLLVHQDLHRIPIQCQQDNDHDVYVYPGVLLYQRQKTTKSRAAPTAEKMLLHVDDAMNSDIPIPFVRAEAGAISRLVENCRLSEGAESRYALIGSATCPAALVTISHGQFKAGQAVVVLDVAKEAYLDTQQVLQIRHPLEIVFHSNCVAARINEPFGGEPLGPVPAFMSKRRTIVIGALMPTHDFWMPLFGALWANALQETDDAHRALRLAKRQFADETNRPAKVIEILKYEYKAVMKKVLEFSIDPLRPKNNLENSISAWSLPAGWWSNYFGAQGFDWVKFREHYAAESARERLINACLMRLFDKPPPGSITLHIDTWLVSYGLPAANRGGD